METGVLPEDFERRLERLKEASGLSWRGLARALGVDPKRLGHWRRGVEPCGGAMHSIYRFASRMPGGPEILMGEDYQMTFFNEENEEKTWTTTWTWRKTRRWTKRTGRKTWTTRPGTPPGAGATAARRGLKRL